MTVRLQVALDRLQLEPAARMAARVAPYADWIEVGTSLIKEFGMDSVRRVVAAAGDTPVLADIKTNDNARYEFELAYDAGAAAATVMATAPDQTVETCFNVARERAAIVLVDLLAVDERRVAALLDRYADGVFAVHVSKDVQEAGGSQAIGVPPWLGERRAAIAGGITLDDARRLAGIDGDLVVIVGSAITAADDPASAARAFAQALGKD